MDQGETGLWNFFGKTKMKTIKVIYDPYLGLTLPDGQIKHFVESFEEDEDHTICVGSETLLTEMRAQHMEKKLKITSLVYRGVSDEFGPDDVVLEIDEDGRIDNWPKGFCGYADDALERLLKGRYE